MYSHLCNDSKLFLEFVVFYLLSINVDIMRY